MQKNSSKTLHSIMARWTSKNERKLERDAESESDESKDKKDKGYCSDKGNNLLSRTWSREEREKQKRSKDRNVNRQTDNIKRNNNVNSSNSEDGEDNVNSSVSRDKIDKRQK